MVNQKTREYNQQYYRNNIDSFKKRDKARLVVQSCPCGGRYSDSSKHTHVKSKKHLKYLDVSKDNVELLGEELS